MSDAPAPPLAIGSRDEALCCLAFLKSGSLLEHICAVLPDARAERVRAAAAGFQGLAASELAVLWREARNAELRDIEDRADRRFGTAWRRLPPSVRWWIASHAHQDHQSRARW